MSNLLDSVPFIGIKSRDFKHKLVFLSMLLFLTVIFITNIFNLVTFFNEINSKLGYCNSFLIDFSNVSILVVKLAAL